MEREDHPHRASLHHPEGRWTMVAPSSTMRPTGAQLVAHGTSTISSEGEWKVSAAQVLLPAGQHALPRACQPCHSGGGWLPMVYHLVQPAILGMEGERAVSGSRMRSVTTHMGAIRVTPRVTPVGREAW